MEASVGELLAFLPVNYLRIAWQFVLDSPLHAVFEGALLLIIAYIVLVKRAYDPSKRGYGARAAAGLTEKEKDELIADWEPQSLVPDRAGSTLHVGAPGVPGPLPGTVVVTDFVAGGRNVRVNVEGRPGAVTTFCTSDFLGLGAHPRVAAAVASTLDEFSFGSCGPRGFYGTTTKHLELEDAIAGFMGTSESITYSDSVATVASAIPAFAKRGDVLLLDAGVSHAVQTGARLSRSRVILFAHNDMRDLRAQLQAVRAADGRRDTSLLQRRFIVVEGLYANSGDVCALAEVAALAREFKWRLIVDDSLGVGVLGRTGRGTAEHCGVAAGGVHVLLGSLGTALGTVGGFCVGSREVVDHQRLSGAGYCFSASAPPYLCAAAATAVGLLREEAGGPALLARLAARCTAVHAALVAAAGAAFEVSGHPLSPVKHLRLRADTRGLLQPQQAGGGRKERAHSVPGGAGAGGGLGELSAAAARAAVAGRVADEAVLAAALQLCLAEGALVGLTHYLPTDTLAPRPSLRACVTLLHTDEELQLLARAVGRAAAAVPALLREVEAAGTEWPAIAAATPSAASAGRRS